MQAPGQNNAIKAIEYAVQLVMELSGQELCRHDSGSPSGLRSSLLKSVKNQRQALFGFGLSESGQVFCNLRARLVVAWNLLTRTVDIRSLRDTLNPLILHTGINCAFLKV